MTHPYNVPMSYFDDEPPSSRPVFPPPADRQPPVTAPPPERRRSGDGGRVSRFLPDGTLDRTVRLPVSRVTSCAFAGPDLDRLVITTAAFERPDEPLAGGLFECVPGVTGLPPAGFGVPGGA